MVSPSRPDYLAVDQSLDGYRFVGIRASPTEHGVHVSVEFVVEDEDTMWAKVDDVMADDRRLALLVGAQLEVHVPEAWQKRYQTFGTAELAKWTGIVRGLIVAKRVSHDGSVQLSEQVTRAVAAASYGGHPTLSAQKSPGPIEMARCMVVAVALASKPAKKQRATKLAIGYSS